MKQYPSRINLKRPQKYVPGLPRRIIPRNPSKYGYAVPSRLNPERIPRYRYSVPSKIPPRSSPTYSYPLPDRTNPMKSPGFNYGSPRSSESAQQKLGERASVEEAFRQIEDAYHRRASETEIKRRVSFKIEDWGENVYKFVRADRSGVPILGSTSLEGQTLAILGITKQGEILAFIKSTKMVTFLNPLSRAPDTSGLWYQVRTLGGHTGWIFAEPSSGGKFASFIQNPVPPPRTQRTQRKSEFQGENQKALRTAVYLLVGIVLFFFFLILVSKSGNSRGYSGSSEYGYSSDSSVGASSDRTNPLFQAKHIEKAIFSKDRILRDDSGNKIGKLEDAIFSKDQIIRDKDGSKVARIEQSVWDKDKQIIKGSDGKKEGEIKSDFCGNRIIVDSDGKKVGKIEKDICGKTVIKKG